MLKKTTRSRKAAPAHKPADKLRTRIQLEYRDISELKNYDITVLVGDIFKRDSGKRVFHKDASGCFIWDGWKDSEGYGNISVEGVTTRVHRLVYERCVGVLSTGEVVRHSCDNPSCIHPLHLLKGKQADNIADKVRRGRQARHADHPMAKLSYRAVACIKQALATGYRNQSALARKYKVSQSTIWCIAHGRIWRNQ